MKAQAADAVGVVAELVVLEQVALAPTHCDDNPAHDLYYRNYSCVVPLGVAVALRAEVAMVVVWAVQHAVRVAAAFAVPVLVFARQAALLVVVLYQEWPVGSHQAAYVQCHC